MSDSSRSTQKDVFLHLLSTILLYMSVYAIIALLFSCINVLLPDALSYAYYYSGELGAIRMAIAVLVVAFPIYIFLMKLIAKDVRSSPAQREIGIRKWLMYLTVFLAAMVIIIDVITLIYSFLNGELGVRFLLKILAVLVVASTVFGYYFMDIRGNMTKKTARMFEWGSSIFVVASIVASFFIAGSPWYQRSVRFDERRVSDLQTIQSQIVNHWQQKNTLPATLGDLTDSISGFSAPLDPETGTAYEYEVTGALTFTLCAEFTTENIAPDGTTPPKMEFYDPYSDNWSHGAERTCFDRTIDPQLYAPVR